MPLPELGRFRAADDANAREYAKRAILTGDSARAAAEVGAPLDVVRDNPAAIALINAVASKERDELQRTYEVDPSAARAALDSREGRADWLKSIVTGELKIEGSFGMLKAAPLRDRLTAMKLLQDMHGDRIIRHQVDVNEQTVYVFRIPDNGRLPDDARIIDAQVDE